MPHAEFLCPDCGSSVAYYSRRRTLTEKYILPLVLLRPVRCADCFKRCYRTVFTSARQPRFRKNAVPASETVTRAEVRRVA